MIWAFVLATNIILEIGEQKLVDNMNSNLKCYRCAECDGFGCPNMIPGLGGVMDGKNFQLNVQGWAKLFSIAQTHNDDKKILQIKISPEKLRCGPVTGAVENIGYQNEEDFYFPYLSNADKSGFGLCVGDGCPDEKLAFGLKAIQKIKCKHKPTSVAFFLKPYTQKKLLERVDFVQKDADFIGIDIDSFNIATMRNLVNLEKKSAENLIEIKNHTDKKFVIKGVFTSEDIELVQKVQPDVVYISNHGGRVETRIGSTAEFLYENAKVLKENCAEIWIGGGIRTKKDIQTALFYGASQVILARPLIRATFDNFYKKFTKTIF